MATFSKLPSGLWQARIRRKGYPTQSKSFDRRYDAEGWARKVEGEIQRGVWRDSSEAERMTLHEALDRYEQEITPRKRAQRTDKSNLRILRDERIAHSALARISSADVATTRDAWRRAGLAPASIKRRMVTLGHVFSTASREWGMSGLTNPVALVRLDPERNARDRRVSDVEIEAITSASGSEQLGAFIRLAVETAMRRGEICGLTWDQVDLQHRVAHLSQTKNGDSRDVPLSPKAVEVLQTLPQHQDGRLFSLQPDSVTQAFERAVARAQARYQKSCSEGQKLPDRRFLVDVRIHDLRHEGISRLAEKLEVLPLAKATGHRDLRMLLRYYHPRATDLAKKLDNKTVS